MKKAMLSQPMAGKSEAEIFFLHRVVQSPHDRAEGVVDFWRLVSS